jgi:hypothetical protein
MEQRRMRTVTALMALLGLLATAAGPGARAQVGESWTRVELPDVPVGLELHDVVAGGPGFIAVGGGTPEGSETQAALIVTSTDGQSWDEVALEGDAAVGRITSVITVGGAWYMAVGGQCCPDNAAVWISEDGLAWRRAPDVPLAFFSSFMTDVTVTSAGFLAVGCQANLECSGGAVFQSPDGLAWTSANPFLWIPNAVVSGPFGYVAVGQTDSLGQPVAAVSVDGSDWTPGGLPDVTGALVGAITVDSNVVAVGDMRDPDTMLPTGLMIAGLSGSTWSNPLEPWAVPGASFADLAVVGESTLVVGFTQLESGETAPSAWVGTTDGPPAAATFSGSDDAMLRSVAVGHDGSTLVGVGVVSGGGGQEPGIWVSQATW